MPRGSLRVASPRAASRGLLPGVGRQNSNGITQGSSGVAMPGVLGPSRHSQASLGIVSSPSRKQLETLIAGPMTVLSTQLKAQEDAKLRCKVVPTRQAVQPPPVCSSRWVQELSTHQSGCLRQSPPPCGASLLNQAANSEDMERRSIDGSASIALSAFDRELSEVTSKVQAVSLGGSCGPKVSLRRLGLGEATMPFDWMRTRVQGLVHWLRNGFDDFLSTLQRLEVNYQDSSMIVYRSPTHSFWHDDLQDEVCREKLRRRVDRFLALAPSREIATDDRDLLFVRGVAGSSELECTEELFLALSQRFEGRRVWLLLVLEDQPILGPVFHSNHDRLIIWVQPRFEGKVSTDVSVPSPYEDAIAFTVRHILGDRGGLYPGEEAEEWPTLDEAAEILTPGSTFWNAGCRHTEVGLWVGHARVNGARSEVLISAFHGFDNVDGNQSHGASNTAPRISREHTGVHSVQLRDGRMPHRVMYGMPRAPSRDKTPSRSVRSSPHFAVVAAY